MSSKWDIPGKSFRSIRLTMNNYKKIGMQPQSIFRFAMIGQEREELPRYWPSHNQQGPWQKWTVRHSTSLDKNDVEDLDYCRSWEEKQQFYKIKAKSGYGGIIIERHMNNKMSWYWLNVKIVEKRTDCEVVSTDKAQWDMWTYYFIIEITLLLPICWHFKLAQFRPPIS